jgi:hypothetical protein
VTTNFPITCNHKSRQVHYSRQSPWPRDHGSIHAEAKHPNPPFSSTPPQITIPFIHPITQCSITMTLFDKLPPAIYYLPQRKHVSRYTRDHRCRPFSRIDRQRSTDRQLHSCFIGPAAPSSARLSPIRMLLLYLRCRCVLRTRVHA